MTRYAQDTSVSVEKSRAEIEATLARYGADQFMARIQPTTNGCWCWTGPLHDAGYGRVRVAGQLVYLHRWMYERVVGLIPSGLTIDHLCRVRSCCNPAHLEAVTRGENVLRGMAATAVAWRNRTCVKGHPMHGENLYVSPKGQSQCRACRRVRHREQARRRRAMLAIGPARDESSK